MTDLSKDAALNRRLLHGHHGRHFTAAGDARWGELIRPGPAENPAKQRQGLRVALIASLQIGHLLIETVKAYERRYPGRINLVAVITDDAVNIDARIGVHKRWWKFYGPKQRQQVEQATIEAALSAAVPVYTGEVKCDWFRRKLEDWRLDAVLMCGFGQLLDRGLIDTPRHGIYNFHPSDLAAGHGAGMAPFDDLYTRHAASSVWSVHCASELIDAGPVVGRSMPINVLNEAGVLPQQQKLVYNKMMPALPALVIRLLDALLAMHAEGGSGWLPAMEPVANLPAGLAEQLAAPVTDLRLAPPLIHPDPELFA